MNELFQVFCLAFVAGFSGLVAWWLFDQWMTKFKRRKEIATARRNVQNCLVKAPVLKVGVLKIQGVTDEGFTSIWIDEWEFETSPGVVIHARNPVLGGLYCGYCADELIEIYRRRAEFEQPERKRWI